MTRHGLTRALMGALALAVACSSDDHPPAQCQPAPAFDLTVRALAGPLPPDTELRVKYGGGVETYRVDGGNPGAEVVICQLAKDGAGAVTAVQCKLWTQSYAEVTVTTSSYPTVVRSLEAQADGDCIRTVPVEIVLGEQDAGT